MMTPDPSRSGGDVALASWLISMTGAPHAPLSASPGRGGRAQVGYQDGFRGLVRDGTLDHYQAMPYRMLTTRQEWASFQQRVVDEAVANRVDTVLLQFFHARGIPSPADMVRELRLRCPGVTVIASCGDPFGRLSLRVPHSMLEAARVADLSFFSGMGHIARSAVRAGAANVLLDAAWRVSGEVRDVGFATAI